MSISSNKKGNTAIPSRFKKKGSPCRVNIMMKRSSGEKTKNFLAILAVAIIIAVVGHVVSVMSYNSKVYRAHGHDDRKSVFMDLDERADSTSSWLKRDFDMNGEKVDLSGQTFDGVLKNASGSELSEWKMRINIKGDCYINNAWCGTVEIHQHADTPEEKVQTLDLRKYELEDVKLDYVYDGDLLMPLSKGDYIIYNPSKVENEMPLADGSELAIGLIFYYLDDIYLSDYSITYKLHRSYYEGKRFYAILALVILWITVLFGHIVANLTYRRAWKDMELRKTGVLYMSDIYDVIYMADLVSGELTDIKGVETGRGSVRACTDASDGVIARLKDLFVEDVTDDYKKVVLEFMDPATIEERFGKDSIACQYMSKTKGWCLVRLFAMDRNEEGTIRKFIFTIQNINDEKTEMDEIEESITGSDIELTGIHIESVPYSIKELIDEVLKDASEEAEIRNAEVTEDISKVVPKKLKGDPDKLRMVISCMLLSALRSGAKNIKLSLFTKETKDGREHLLVSVRDDGEGKDDSADFTGLGLNVAGEMLKLMDSGLNVIRNAGEGSELYFEIEQEKA